MVYIKRFENFDLGRFSEEENEEQNNLVNDVQNVDDFCEDCIDDESFYEKDDDDDDDESKEKEKVWGDEVIESFMKRFHK